MVVLYIIIARIVPASRLYYISRLYITLAVTPKAPGSLESVRLELCIILYALNRNLLPKNLISIALRS